MDSSNKPLFPVFQKLWNIIPVMVLGFMNNHPNTGNNEIFFECSDGTDGIYYQCSDGINDYFDTNTIVVSN